MTCNITGIVRTPDGALFKNGTITFYRQSSVGSMTDGSDSFVVIPEKVKATTNSAGEIDTTLTYGSYRATAEGVERSWPFLVGVPNAASALFYECVELVPELSDTISGAVLGYKEDAEAAAATATTKAGEASSSATDASNFATTAQKWAANPEDTEVTTGLYSALHYAAKASDSATSANAAALTADAHKDTFAAAVAATDIAVGQVVAIESGYNGTREYADVVAAGTYASPDGVLVRDATGISAQIVSKRTDFASFDEMVNQDPRTFAAGTTLTIPSIGATYSAVAASGNLGQANAGGQEFDVLPGPVGYSFKSFGAVGAGLVDNLSVWNAAKSVATLATGKTLIVEPGNYYFSDTPTLDVPLHIVGAGSAIAAGVSTFEPPSCFILPASKDGLTVVGGGNYSVIERIGQKALGKSAVAHGFVLERRAELRLCYVEGFTGDGYNIDTQLSGGNCNLWRMEYCHANLCDGNGLFLDGPDSNAGTNIGFNATSCGQWGIRDSSFLGNHHYGCHTSDCGGAYMSDNVNASETFIGCYSENKQWDVIHTEAVFGGSNSFKNLAGPAPRGAFIYANSNTTQVQRVDVTSAGSGYSSAPTVTIAAPSGTSTATATATIGADGKVKYITVVSKGAGYGAAPTVTLSGGGGSGATATAYIAKPLYGSGYGEVWMIAVDSQGSGYTSAPTVTVAAPTTTTATATAVLNSIGGVAHVVIKTTGTGYTSAPAVSFSGGGGSGAAATAVLSQGETRRAEVAQTDQAILQWRSSHMSSSSTAYTRMQYSDDGSGDVVLDYNNTNTYLTLTGARTEKTFGRNGPQRYLLQVPSLVLTSRNMSMASTVPPTSGEYARGDMIFAINPSAGGSPGVVCTTSGTAGSTAVFKAMSNLAV